MLTQYFKICIAGILFIAFFRCVYGIDTRPVSLWDEQTNVDVINDTYTSRTFPFLIRNGEPFFEKPPVWYGVGLLLRSVNDNTLVLLRFVSAFSGFFIICLSLLLSWRISGPFSSVCTGIFLITANQLFIINPAGFFSTHTFQSADSDTLYILFLFVATAISLIRQSNGASIALGIFAGLATLTKSPVGVLPILIYSGDSIFFDRTKRKNIPRLPLVSYMCVTFPWLIYMIFTYHQPFLTTFVGYHLFNRVLLPLEGHVHPWNYYFMLLSNRSVVIFWEMMIFAVGWIIFQKHLRTKRVIRIIYITCIMLLVMPLFVKTTLAWYILPIYPYISILVGVALSDFLSVLKLIPPPTPT